MSADLLRVPARLLEHKPGVPNPDDEIQETTYLKIKSGVINIHALAHQDCIYMRKNTVELWNNITILKYLLLLQSSVSHDLHKSLSYADLLLEKHDY